MRRIYKTLPYLIVLGSWLYYLAYFNYGFIMNDEGFLFECTLRVLQGQLPQHDFFSYGPLRYYYLATWFQLVGVNVVVERIALLTFGTLVPLLMFLIARRILPTVLALVPTVMVLIVPGVWIKMPETILPILNLWLILRYLDQPSWKSLALCGISAGLAVMMAEYVGFLIILSQIFLVWLCNDWHDIALDKNIFAITRKRLESASIYSGSVVLGMMPLLVFYARAGAISSLFFTTAEHVTFEVSSYGLIFLKPLFELDWRHPASVVETSLVYISFISLIVFPVGLAIRWKRNRRINPLLVALWLTAWTLYPTTFVMPIYSRMSWTAQLSYLVGTVIAFWIFCWIKKRSLILPVQTRIVPMLVGLSFFLIPLAFLIIGLGWDNPFVGSISRRFNRPVRWSFPAAPIYDTLDGTVTVEEIVKYVLSNTSPDETIFAGADHGFYFLTGRQNPTGLYFAPMYFSTDAVLYKRFLNDLEHSIPRILIRRQSEVVDTSQNPSWWTGYIAQHYEMRLSNTMYVLYERIP